jgi:hypothetical protein
MEVSALARLSKHASLVRFYGLACDGVDHDYLITELAPQGGLLIPYPRKCTSSLVVVVVDSGAGLGQSFTPSLPPYRLIGRLVAVNHRATGGRRAEHLLRSDDGNIASNL